ncbi:MAG: phosphatase PAP2 family protein [Bdellovibrionaceae bacterium]|nr:phosphatase PAP2 family protein [Pseudobdellovibrionaceae bacterium]
MNSLIAFDHTLFEKINGAWTHPFLDTVMPVLTDLHRAGPWPYVLATLVLLFWLYKSRARAAKTLVLIALSIALSDALSYRVLKPHYNRLRPEFSGVAVTLRTESHSGRSFPSNHAANNFAAANTLTYIAPQFGWLWFLCAFVIAYSRIYVGVHFPLDVLGGASVGILMSMLVWRLFGRRWVLAGAKLKPKLPADATPVGKNQSDDTQSDANQK